MAVQVLLLHAALTGLPLELRWEAPPECPRQGDVLDLVARMVRPQTPMSADQWVRASASIGRTGETWWLRLDTQTPEGEGHRELAAASCSKIAEAAALILALAIDPEANLATAPPVPRVPVRWAIRPEVRGDVGTLPGATAGGGLALAAARGPWRLEASGSTWVPRTSGSALPGAGGEIGLSVSGGLRGCREIHRGAFAIGPCAGAEVGYLRGRGVGVAEPRDGSAVDAAVAAGVFGAVRMTSRLSLRVGGEALVWMRRPTFIIEGVGEVHQQAPVAARVTMGLEISPR